MHELIRDPRFFTQAGQLSAYAYACGYVQLMGNGWKLFKDGCYHLRRSRAEWHTFATLAEAYAAMRRINKTTRYEACAACFGTGDAHGPNGELLPGIAAGIAALCHECSGNGNYAIKNERE